MQPSRRDFLRFSGATAVLGGMGSLSWSALPAGQTITADNPILHFLNRISWGARPEEVERANSIGFEAYLEEQLHPDTLDDSATDAILAKMPILEMDRRTAYRLSDPEYRSAVALSEGMIARAVHSQRQLQERMVEFWSDHFNIPSDELGVDLLTFQREVIRTNALGNFRDMLFGTAQNPAMLYYLDNYLNEKEHPNENYAREIMELHTLGVDGGYTEQDVKEVARAFTGWTIRDGIDSGFFFDKNMHDTGEKVVLGHTLPAERGIEDGLHVLSLLANHASTARYLSRKLCVRFVSDNPPQSLVDSTAMVWITQKGEITPVLRHIFLSNEFWASAGQKLRRPLDFFVAALRATGTEFRNFYVMEEMLSALAQRPYGWHPPNGYPDAAGAWLSSSGLLARWNTAFNMTHDAFSTPDSGMKTQLRERIGQPATVGELVDAVARQVFATRLPDKLRTDFIGYASDFMGEGTAVTPHLIAQKLGTLYGLMLASPQFQWR